MHIWTFNSLFAWRFPISFVFLCCYTSALSQVEAQPLSLQEETIHIAITICGIHHIVFAHGLLGSLLMNAQAHRIHLYVMADTLRAISMECYYPGLLQYFRNVTVLNRHDYRHIMAITPNIHLDGYFRCACDRLFFYQLFPNVDHMLYLDTDTLVVEDLQHLWDFNAQMGERIIVSEAHRCRLKSK